MLTERRLAWVFAVLLGLLYLGASVLVIVRFEARRLQDELGKAGELAGQLEEQARRYQIELATLTDYTEVHAAAAERLGMVFPDPADGSLLVLGDKVR